MISICSGESQEIFFTDYPQVWADIIFDLLCKNTFLLFTSFLVSVDDRYIV